MSIRGRKNWRAQPPDEYPNLASSHGWQIPSLDILGVGKLEIFPRRVLALYDGQENPDGLQQTDLHKLLAMPLEHLGYAIDYLDVNAGCQAIY